MQYDLSLHCQDFDYKVKVNHAAAGEVVSELIGSLAKHLEIEADELDVTIDQQNVRSAWLIFGHARYSLGDIAMSLKQVDCEVLRWVRSRVGPFTNDELKPGEWRRLHDHELEAVEGIVSSGIQDSVTVDDVWTKIAESTND